MILFFTDENTAFAVGDSGQVWRYKNYVTNIEREETTSPDNFILYQNYPNPFNPTTKIKYTIPSAVMLNSFQHPDTETPNQVRDDNMVTLKIFDILGNEIATLVNEQQPAGTYEVEFNSQQFTNKKQLPSGVYFYRLNAGSFIQTKKLILLK